MKISELFDCITDFTVDGKCSSCGACCGNILPVSAQEVNVIHQFVEEHSIKEFTIVPLAQESVYMTCPFRDTVKKICSIYAVRPEICRVFSCGADMHELQKARDSTRGKKHVLVDFRAEFYGRKMVAERMGGCSNEEVLEYVEKKCRALAGRRPV